jgi:hypothetical protein
MDQYGRCKFKDHLWIYVHLILKAFIWWDNILVLILDRLALLLFFFSVLTHLFQPAVKNPLSQVIIYFKNELSKQLQKYPAITQQVHDIDQCRRKKHIRRDWLRCNHNCFRKMIHLVFQVRYQPIIFYRKELLTRLRSFNQCLVIWRIDYSFYQSWKKNDAQTSVLPPLVSRYRIYFLI